MLFDLIGEDGRHDVFNGEWRFPEGFSPAVQIFLEEYASTITALLNRSAPDRPLRIRLMQLRRYTAGAPAPAENNNSDVFHVDSIYLRTFITPLGKGLIVGRRVGHGVEGIELPRAVACAFSGTGRAKAHAGSVLPTPHRGRTVGGTKDDRGITRGSVYDTDRFSIVADFSPE